MRIGVHSNDDLDERLGWVRQTAAKADPATTEEYSKTTTTTTVVVNVENVLDVLQDQQESLH